MIDFFHLIVTIKSKTGQKRARFLVQQLPYLKCQCHVLIHLKIFVFIIVYIMFSLPCQSVWKLMKNSGKQDGKKRGGLKILLNLSCQFIYLSPLSVCLAQTQCFFFLFFFGFFFFLSRQQSCISKDLTNLLKHVSSLELFLYIRNNKKRSFDCVPLVGNSRQLELLMLPEVF